jgi:eukaryotic-like serine/threonine-protein kinase
LTLPTPKKQPIPFGRYLLLDRVNIGGMAEVWRGKVFGAGAFERLVAIKRILPNIAEDEEFISMFQDEAKISVQLTHANICQIYELNRIGSSLYIAMEYVPGKDLRSIFERARKKGEPPPVPLVCYVIGKLCEGLDYAHRKKDSYGRELNVVHRDVSPQNVLISFEGEVKVIDFGIAKAAGKVTKTQAGILKGKFGYMSPEQIRGLPLDRRSDVFAIGVCLYELLTGERLFIGESDFQVLEKVRKAEVLPPSTYNRKIPEALERIVLKALAKDPEDRFQYASDLADELQRFLITSDSIFSRKDLMQFMKSTFAEEVERERARLAEYAEIKAPEGMFTAIEGGAVSVPVVTRPTGPILAAVPPPSAAPAVVVRGSSLPKLTAAAPQSVRREDESSTLVVEAGEALAQSEPSGPLSVQPIAGDEPSTDPERVAIEAPGSEVAQEAAGDETIVRVRHEPMLGWTAAPPVGASQGLTGTPSGPMGAVGGSGPATASSGGSALGSATASGGASLDAGPLLGGGAELDPSAAPSTGWGAIALGPETGGAVGSDAQSTPPAPATREPPAEQAPRPSVSVPDVTAPRDEALDAEALAAVGKGPSRRRWPWIAVGLLPLLAAGATLLLRPPAAGRLVIDVNPAEARSRVHLSVGGQEAPSPTRWPLVQTVPPGKVEVLASAEGYKPALVEATVKAGAATPLLLSLQRAGQATRLVVVTEPDDAEVRLDGAVVKKSGTRGFYVGEVQGGSEHAIQIRRAGYRPYETRVSARTTDEPLEVRTALEAMDYAVLVTSSPPGAVVFSGERQLGVTPVSARIPGTSTALTLRKRCFETAQIPLRLPEQPGPRISLRATLRKVPGCR